ncbi:MAG TPA: histidine kinase [Arenimonas sp.]|uniref:sensor histidine kinase n=1 Tax=Arenimonas sp. TaxID=1872635 RepID=UPI002BB2B226|nr:histidine kinase [Arenimonas sp.]HMB56841.1 histidine kinase [Arenimonas sp.]
MQRKTATLCLVIFVWWTLNGLATGAEWMTMLDAAGHQVSWSKAMPASVIGAWGWMPLTLGLVWLVRRYPVEHGRIARALAIQAAAVALIVVLRAIYIYGLDGWLHWYDAPPTFSEVLLQSVWNNLFQAWLIIGVAHALLLSERVRERERQTITLQSQLADARLSALASQLNPHFLFNALNSIAELVHRDADAADRMIVGLSALLRSSLEKAGTQVVALQEELRLLGYYLDIEKIRLGDRLHVDWSVAPDTLAALVPPLLLQPLVENSVRHGISRRVTPGRIVISARREMHQLVLEVLDDGGDVGIRTSGNGVGLATTRARLECLYGEAFGLELIQAAQAGTIARLTLPFHALEAAA